MTCTAQFGVREDSRMSSVSCATRKARTGRSKAVRTAADIDCGAGQKNRLLLPRNAATASSRAGGSFTRPPLSTKACNRPCTSSDSGYETSQHLSVDVLLCARALH